MEASLCTSVQKNRQKTRKSIHTIKKPAEVFAG